MTKVSKRLKKKAEPQRGNSSRRNSDNPECAPHTKYVLIQDDVVMAEDLEFCSPFVFDKEAGRDQIYRKTGLIVLESKSWRSNRARAA